MSQYSAAGAERTLSAFFDSRHDAERATERLADAGIARDNIRLVPGYESDAPVENRQEAHRGFFASLADFFMPDEDRYGYAEGLSRGGFLVTVNNLDGAQHDVALDILDDEGAIDFDQREESWRSEGWTGYSTDYSGTGYRGDADADIDAATLGSAETTSLGAAGFAAGETARSTDYVEGDDEVIPVINEELRVGKRDRDLGRVRVRSYLREEPVSADVSLHEEHVTIERRPVDRAIGAGDAAFQDRTIEAREHAEEAVIDKQARVTEEISLRREGSERTETIHDTVRKTEVEVEDERDASFTQRQKR